MQSMNKSVLFLAIFSTILSIFFIATPETYAQEKPYATVINQIRGNQLGLTGIDLEASLKAHHQSTAEEGISATWLWQFSALENSNLIQYAKQEMQKDEHGLFLEIDPNTAEKNEIRYRGTHQWYHSDGLFLTSYDVWERQKLIDGIFEKFKQQFGYYPTAVGAWWVGAEPIKYMKQKYGITAVLQCADQFGTDAYSIWGTPWSIPYIPREDNAAVPSDTKKSGVVIMQWAPRELLNGYGKDSEASTFSAQDFHLKGYPTQFLDKLKDQIATQKIDQIIVGVESGFPPESFKTGHYKAVMQKIKQWNESKQVQLAQMSEVSQSLLKEKKPPLKQNMITKDADSQDQSYWYHSSVFRINVIKNKDGVLLRDIRDYQFTGQEEFYQTPNIHPYFKVNTHAVIDTIRFPSNLWKISDNNSDISYLVDGKEVVIMQGSTRLLTIQSTQFVVHTDNAPPSELSPLFKSNNSTHKYRSHFPINRDIKKLQYHLSIRNQHLFQDLSANIIKAESWINFRKRNQAISVVTALLICVSLILIIKLFSKKINLYKFLVLPLILFSITEYIYQLSTKNQVTINDFEIDALLARNITPKNSTIIIQEIDLNYQSSKPLLYNASTISIKKFNHDNKKEVTNIQSQYIIVPRFMFGDLFDPELQNKKKIFDNSQIAIYE